VACFSLPQVVFNGRLIARLAVKFLVENVPWSPTWLFLGHFLSKKYLRHNSILGTNEYKIRRNNGTIEEITFQIDIIRVPLFFRIFCSFVPIIEICIKWFLDKIFQKQPLWVAGDG
jgi:hypothetical protein